MRVTFKTKTSQIKVPAVVRPVSLKLALKQLAKRDMTYPKGDREPTVSWDEARKRTQVTVDKSLKKWANAWVREYTDMNTVVLRSMTGAREVNNLTTAAHVEKRAGGVWNSSPV